MQSVGEAMAIGRTFPESLQKALRSLEQGRLGLNCDPAEAQLADADRRRAAGRRSPCRRPTASFQVGELLRRGVTVERDPRRLPHRPVVPRPDAGDHRGAPRPRRARRPGRPRRPRLAAGQAARLRRRPARPPVGHRRGRRSRAAREAAGVAADVQDGRHVRRRVRRRDAVPLLDLRGRERGPAVRPADGRSSSARGPNRIGQGIEFDYCCVHASFALRDAGFETVMINCNPETVSHRLRHARPPVLRAADARGRAQRHRRRDRGRRGRAAEGDRVARRADAAEAGRRLIPAELIAGTSPASIDLAEDREKWNALCDELRIPQPPGGTATDLEQALQIVDGDRLPGARAARATCSAGGRCRSSTTATTWPTAMAELAGFGSLGREGGLSAERPVLIDRFLEDAVEVDVDAVRDHTGEVLIGGVMEHVEEAGVHSRRLGLRDPAADAAVVGRRGDRGVHARRSPTRLDVRGLINVQYAVHRHDRLRHRGQPAGQPHRAVRRQGHRRAAGQGGDAGDARGDARRAARRGAAARRRCSARQRPPWRSRRPCCRSPGSPRSTRRSARRCARPAR